MYSKPASAVRVGGGGCVRVCLGGQGWNRPDLLSVFSGRSTAINGASHGLLEPGLMSGWWQCAEGCTD